MITQFNYIITQIYYTIIQYNKTEFDGITFI